MIIMRGILEVLVVMSAPSLLFVVWMFVARPGSGRQRGQQGFGRCGAVRASSALNRRAIRRRAACACPALLSLFDFDLAKLKRPPTEAP
jgi:hypothetical protein